MTECKTDTNLPEGVKRYRKGRVLSKSLYGNVRYGKDIVTDKWVVIKECKIECVVAKRTTEDIEVAEDIYKEMELHGRLSKEKEPCPYIIKLLDICQDTEFIYIVLEYAESGDLFGHVTTRLAQIIARANQERNPQRKKQLFAEWHQRVRTWMKQILTAVRFMHDRGICHRDLSLENVMLDAELNAKVIDFGCSHEFKDNKWSTERNPIGKTGYMSPECYAGHFYNAKDNDMWCVGVMLWMALIGAPPWELPTDRDMRYKFIMNGKSGICGLLQRWKRSDFCPEPAVDLLSRIFRKQKDRITVTEALNHPFITGNNDPNPLDLYEPFHGSFQPDSRLCEKWANIRHTEEKKVAEPAVWTKLDTGSRSRIQKFLAQTNERYCIFDRRVVKQLENNFELSLEDAHKILMFFMGASRNRLKASKEEKRSPPRRDPFLYHKRSEEEKLKATDKGMDEDPANPPASNPPPQQEDTEMANNSPHDSDERSMDSDHKDDNSDDEGTSSSSGHKENLANDVQKLSVDATKDEEMEDGASKAAQQAVADNEEVITLRANYKANDKLEHSLTVKKNLTLKQIKFSFALAGAKHAGLTFIPPPYLTLFVNNGTKLTDTKTLQEGFTIYGEADVGARDLEMGGQNNAEAMAVCPLKAKLEALKRAVTGESEETAASCAAEWLGLLPQDFLTRLSRILTDSADHGQALIQMKQLGLTEDLGLEAINFFSKVPDSPGGAHGTNL